MLDIDEGEEAFFDSVDSLSFEGLAVEEKDSLIQKLEYEIWTSEPQSVRERKKSFLREMGLTGFGFKNDIAGDSAEMMALERITECSGAALGSSPSTKVESDSLCERDGNGDANYMFNELEHDEIGHNNMQSEREPSADSSLAKECRHGEMQTHIEIVQSADLGGNKLRSWWNGIMKKRSISDSKAPEVNRMNVRHNSKSCKELSAMFTGQEIHGHEGYIWTMKFSPDGQYLASGGEDGVVRIWRITSADASCKCLTTELPDKVKEGKTNFQRRKTSHASIVIPKKVFQIEEFPLHEFYGHASDVLDLAWSSSNCLLSSSKDKTVRLWQLGCNECLNIFYHSNYVTCIQFNPVDENFFVSGSVDGKVRIWGVSERRVVDWADVRDVVTAICYRSHGKGFVVGTVTGTCHFYEASDDTLQRGALIHIQGRRKASSNKITGIQCSKLEPQRVMITSDDSKVRILDGIEVVHKYKALRKSGSQMSASFTSTEKHIVSVGEDSRVYVWNYDGSSVPSSKPKKSIRSCEHFSFEGVSVAIPWSSTGAVEKCMSTVGSHHCLQLDHSLLAASSIRESERFSLGNWFSTDGPSRRSTTWPEEKLPVWGSSVSELDHCHHLDNEAEGQPMQHHDNHNRYTALSASWGAVIVAASWDGTIRTFQNYGLPIKL